MKCFCHHDADALGVCKNCQRGICVECITEVVPDGIACKGRCEAGAVTMGKLWRQSEGSMLFFATFLYLLGFAFIGWTVYEGLVQGYGYSGFPFVMGGLFVLSGLFLHIKMRRKPEP